MSSAPTSPSPDFAQASAWLAAAPEGVRATIGRHLTHHQIEPDAKGALSTLAQLSMIEKALAEHHTVLLPSFRKAAGLHAPALPAPHLGFMERKLVGEEDAFLRAHTGSYITGLDATLGQVSIALPAYLSSREAATDFARHLFSSQGVNASESPVNGHYRITLAVYDVKRDVDRIRKPVGFRALPTRTADERMLMEEEFRVLTGADAPPREKEMEALVQDVGMKKALEELTKDYRLIFTDNFKDGVYVFPIKTEQALIAQGARALLETGAIGEAEAAVVPHGKGRALHITPHALSLLEDALYHGIQGKTVSVPAVDAPSAIKARQEYFHGLEINEAKRDLAKAQIVRMNAAERSAVENALQHSGDAPAINAVSKAIEQSVAAQEHAVKGAPRYDQETLRRAIAFAQAVYKEDRLWTHLDNAQLASHHNSIREDHRDALSQLDALLAAQPYSQAGLTALITMPRFADAIRDSGHFLSIVARQRTAKDGKQEGPAYDSGAADYARAFQLSGAAMQPQSSAAKSASYHMRAMISDVGWGEAIGRNLFMGLRPIYSSVELAVKKPVLCGATILGIAAYSSVVPERYSIPVMLNNLMHRVIEGLGVKHGDKDTKQFKVMIDNTIEDVKRMGTGDSFLKGMKVGRKLGIGQAAAIGASAFVAFNLVEDVIVHLPLALVSVGVGAAGGATGRKVLTPVLDDVGDLVGRFAPEPVRAAWRQDMKSAQAAYDQPWLSRIRQNMRGFAYDIDDMGIIVTGRHAVSSATQGLSHLLGGMFGQAHAPQAGAAR